MSHPERWSGDISEVGGKEASAEPNREIGFGFVSCSCRACVRAGEAKLRGRVRGVPPHRWALGLQIVLLLPATCSYLFVAIHVGFKLFWAKSFVSVLESCAQARGF